MNTTTTDDAALLSIPGSWHISYNYAAGYTASRFFLALRDEEKIMATRCPVCARTLVPPRSYCDRCFRACETWCEVGPEGSVVTFTVCNRRSPGIDRDPPFMIALIRLDGADTNLIHIVEGCELSHPDALLDRVRAGLRVRPEFRPRAERVGQILDIQCFRALT